VSASLFFNFSAAAYTINILSAYNSLALCAGLIDSGPAVTAVRIVFMLQSTALETSLVILFVNSIDN